MTIHVGLIGAGVMGSDHARTITQRISSARVSAVADVDGARAEQLAHELGCRAHRDAVELIGSDDVEGVIIASHDSSHCEYTIAAIAAGKPVLCEKPMAPSVDECLEIVQAERARGGSTGSLVSVGFHRRFDPAILALRDALRRGIVGRPLILHAVHRSVSTSPGGDSAFTVRGSAIHELDQIPWMLGNPVVEVSWVAPRTTRRLPGRQDPQLILLRTADGVLTTIEVFVNAVYGYDVRLEVVGESGTLSLATPVQVVHNGNLHGAFEYPRDWRPRFADAYRAELQAWVDSVTQSVRSPLMADALDGLRATAVADAVVESMHGPGGMTLVNDPNP